MKRTLAILASAIAAYVLVALAILMLKAEAHDAIPTADMPLGWTFHLRCCGSGDCYSVPATAFGVTPGGYLIRATGEVIPYQSNKILPSPDGMPYRCSVAGKVSGRTYCIYVGEGGV